MSPRPLRGADAFAFAAILAPLGVLLFVEAFLSLGWRMVHDTPLLHFAAYQVDQFGLAPYREVFITSMPGALAVHIGIGRVFGWGDIGFQVANLVFLASLLVVTWGVLSRSSSRAGWTAVVLYGLYYFAGGPWTMLQRDVIGMLPVATAFFVAGSARPGLVARSLCIGLLFGLAAAIKPHLLIGLPVVLVFAWRRWFGAKALSKVERPRWSSLLLSLAVTGLGVALPLLWALWWVWSKGGLSDFGDMMRNYLPLHLRLSGDHETIEGADRLGYIAGRWRTLGGHGVWVGPAALGLYLALDPREPRADRDTAVALGALAIAYGVYPAVAGQFWDYHWMPLQLWLIATAALVARPRRSPGESPLQRLVAPVLLAVCVATTITPPPGLIDQLAGRALEPPKEGRVDAIASFLTEHAEPGDKVQSLDWTGGALHGMLIARVETATRYIYDYHFYHHVSDPAVQRHRQRLMAELSATPPRFVVQFDGPRVHGEDTTTSFSALEAFLDDGYVSRLEGDTYRILERRVP